MQQATFEAMVRWLLECHKSPETHELFSRVIDWELALFLADSDLGKKNIKAADVATKFNQTSQTARNRIRKLRETGLLESTDDNLAVTDEFRDLMTRYLQAMHKNLQQTAVSEYLPSDFALNHLLLGLIKANDLQRSGLTLMTGMAWIVCVELVNARLTGTTRDSTQLAASCRCSLNTMTSHLNPLKDRGLLVDEVSPNDRRKKTWQLAPRGDVEVLSYAEKVFGFLEQSYSESMQ